MQRLTNKSNFAYSKQKELDPVKDMDYFFYVEKSDEQEALLDLSDRLDNMTDWDYD